ncbi:MAG: S8 family serine peptidase, partial [Bacteroides sp.]|nr:S8 family serine peptidase [Bacteroides sp.]
MKTKLFYVILLAAAFAGPHAAAQDAQYEENALYVRLKESASPKAPATGRFLATEKISPLQELQARYGLHRTVFSMRTLGSPVLERTFELRFDSTARAEELIDALQNDRRIELVERIPVYHVQGQTAEAPVAAEGAGADDPLYQKSYGAWHLKMIHAEEAWAKQAGSPKVKVAVVDNAVWGNHPDLGIAPENQYNVKDGQTGNSAPPSSVPQDPDCPNVTNCVSYNWSHGTHCAGAVGAIRNNGEGIASIGSGITLMGVSCPGTDPSGLQVTNGFSGVSYAAEHGAKVISISWGNYTIAETEKAIIQSCIDKGIVVVAAAGNNNYKDSPMYPGYLPGVISVAAVNDNGQISSFSNYGDWVTVAAPGGFMMDANNQESKTSLLSTTYCTSQNYRVNGHSEIAGMYYDGMYGTSMATPVVSGLCGLLLSADTAISPYMMREILMASAQDITAGSKNICANSGIIDAAAALSLLKRAAPMPEAVKIRRVNRQIELSWEKPSSLDEIKAYQLFLDNVPVGETDGETTSFLQDISRTGRLHRMGVRALYANGDTSLKACADIEIPELYDVEVSVRPAGCGTVEGAGAYVPNDNITL